MDVKAPTRELTPWAIVDHNCPRDEERLEAPVRFVMGTCGMLMAAGAMGGIPPPPVSPEKEDKRLLTPDEILFANP